MEWMNHNLDMDNYFLPMNREYLDWICRENLPKGCRVLEIGSWKGLTTSIIGSVVKEREGILYCIDTWEGSITEEVLLEEVREKDIFGIFKNNMQVLGLWDVIVPVIGNSLLVKEIFPDNFFDMVFIDADHTYDFVMADLQNYISKVKLGGVICGDDCEGYAEEALQEIREKKNEVWITASNGKVYHAGVVYALHKLFGTDYNIGEGSTFWWKDIRV